MSWVAQKPPEPSDESGAGAKVCRNEQDLGWVCGNLRPVARSSFSLMLADAEHGQIWSSWRMNSEKGLGQPGVEARERLYFITWPSCCISVKHKFT